MIRRSTGLSLTVLGVLALAPPAGAQPYARFAVPDSALAPAIQASGAQFEPAWNALLIAELRATQAKADSAARLFALARRVAVAEPTAIGSRIGSESLRLRTRWTASQRRLRIAAGGAESLGVAAQAKRDFPRADSLLGAALGIYERLGERRRVAWVWGTLGSVSFLRGDMVASDSLYRRALAARRAIGDQRMIGNALNTLGTVSLNLRRYDDAWRFCREARAIREQIGDWAAAGTTLNNLGLIASAQGKPDTAAVYYRAALVLTVSQGDSTRTNEVLNNYALSLMRGRDPAAALPLFARALAIARTRGDALARGLVLDNMGELLRQQGHFAQAVERLTEARSFALAARNANLEREVSINLGRAAIGVGDAAAAGPPLERALAIADSLGDAVAQAQALNDMSIAAKLAGDARGAERLALRALAAAASGGDSSRVHDAASTLGELAFDRVDVAAADTWFARAAKAGATEESQRAGDIINLGAVAALSGRLDDAEQHFKSALALSDRAQSPDFAWPALLGLGDVAERRGHHAAALAFDRQAAAMIEGLRSQQGSERPSVRLLAKRLFAFEALIHLLTRLQPSYPESAYAAEAFGWSERARARAFLDLVAASGGEAQRARPVSLAEAQKLIHTDKQALLVYSVGDSSTSLWVLTQRSWTHHTLPPRKALRARVEILRRGLADPASAESKTTHVAARALYRTLIEPALPSLKGVDQLIVAPDGALALIPFEALLATDVEKDGAPPRGAYLVEHYAVSYAPSASALATRTGAVGGAGGIVALGNPNFVPDSTATGAPAPLPALPNTAAEISALVRLAAGRPLTTLTGRDATRERLLGLAELPKAALIHVATHGEANEAEPERSGLWLATAKGTSQPGFVSMPDILGLKLSAGLVTLSACETGLGRLEGGEGVIGLTRAFLAAGSQSVMVSLWKVNDRSTAMLMERFYRDYLGRGSAGATALAQAKRALLKDTATRSAFYWAPFVMVGGAGKLGG